MSTLEVWTGHPYPLGATVTRDGVNFALFSENATEVHLCLFDDAAAPAETVRIRILEKNNHIWHCFIPGLRDGQFYGYHVHGPFEPGRGNPLVHKHGAVIIVHHTNKPPSGAEKPDWSGSDFAYLGSGRAEWSNWPRAILAVRSLGSHEIYILRAGKRGSRCAGRTSTANASTAGFPRRFVFLEHVPDSVGVAELRAELHEADVVQQLGH